MSAPPFVLHRNIKSPKILIKPHNKIINKTKIASINAVENRISTSY